MNLSDLRIMTQRVSATVLTVRRRLVVIALVLFTAVVCCRATPIAPAQSLEKRQVIRTQGRPTNVGQGPTGVVVNIPPSESWWKTLLAALSGAVTTAVITLRVASRSFWQRANEEEIKRLNDGLVEFYGPFMRLLDVTFLLSQDLRSRLGDPNYRMLLALTDRRWLAGLSSGDKAIVEEVITNDAQLEELILTKSGGRVDDDVADYLSHAVAHFRMIKRAKRGELTESDREMLKPYVFPKHLRKVMRLQRDWIQTRITKLQSGLHRPATMYLQLVLQEDLKAPKWPDPERADV